MRPKTAATGRRKAHVYSFGSVFRRPDLSAKLRAGRRRRVLACPTFPRTRLRTILRSGRRMTVVSDAHTNTLRRPPARSFAERSGRRKTLPKLIKCALRRPVAAVLGSQSFALCPGARMDLRTTLWSGVSALALNGTPVQVVSPGFTAISQLRNPVSRERAKLSKTSCPARPARPRTPAPSPMARCAHRTSQ